MTKINLVAPGMDVIHPGQRLFVILLILAKQRMMPSIYVKMVRVSIGMSAIIGSPERVRPVFVKVRMHASIVPTQENATSLRMLRMSVYRGIARQFLILFCVFKSKSNRLGHARWMALPLSMNDSWIFYGAPSPVVLC